MWTIVRKVIIHTYYKVKFFKKQWIAKRYIFSDRQRPVRKKHVNLHYWKKSSNLDNVGDLLSLIVVEYFLKQKKINLHQKTKKQSI